MSFPKFETVPLSSLLVDSKNPRLPRQPDNQRDTIRLMAEVLGPKLVAICADIVKRGGLNPAQLFIAIPGDNNDRIALDGNRRLTGIRVLENPEIVNEAVPDSIMKRLRALSKEHDENDALPIEDARCVVFAQREDADGWIELIHEGELNGAGHVPWTAQMKTRHRDRGSKGKSYEAQILDITVQEGDVSEDTKQRHELGKYPISTLQRLFSSPEVRHIFGIDYTNGQVTTRFPREEVLKGLSRAVDDIGKGSLKVTPILAKAGRIKYAENLPATAKPDPSTKQSASVPIQDAPKQTPKPKGKKRSSNTTSSKRDHLIPSTFNISIPEARLNDIFLELQRDLMVHQTPNAAAVLLRVFLELSTDSYIARHNVKITSKKTHLEGKIGLVADHMGVEKTMTDKQLIPIRQVTHQPDSGGGSGVTTLNQFVHHRNYQPSGPELIAMWTRVETFVQQLWA